MQGRRRFSRLPADREAVASSIIRVHRHRSHLTNVSFSFHIAACASCPFSFSSSCPIVRTASLFSSVSPLLLFRRISAAANFHSLLRLSWATDLRGFGLDETRYSGCIPFHIYATLGTMISQHLEASCPVASRHLRLSFRGTKSLGHGHPIGMLRAHNRPLCTARGIFITTPGINQRLSCSACQRLRQKSRSNSPPGGKAARKLPRPDKCSAGGW